MTHLHTLTLHQLRYGELDGPSLAAARAHLDLCPACAERLRAQEAERAAFVARPVPAFVHQLAREVEPATPTAANGGLWLRMFAGLLVAAAVFLTVRTVRMEATTPTATEPTVRYRGELPSVEVWVRGEQGPRALRAGEAVAPGRAVQLKYDPHGASVVAIAGRDGSGRIEVYTTNAPTGIGLVTAPFALTLDGTPGPQELFVLGAHRTLDADTVRAAIGNGVPGVRVARVRIEKP